MTENDKRRLEKAFYKESKSFYASALDECGDINKALAMLKNKLVLGGTKLPGAKWTRLDRVLRSGEIRLGKRCTPEDWAVSESRIEKAKGA